MVALARTRHGGRPERRGRPARVSAVVGRHGTPGTPHMAIFPSLSVWERMKSRSPTTRTAIPAAAT